MITIACASDDGINFSKKHFGDVNVYKIYNISPDGYEYVDSIENRSKEYQETKEAHGDPIKAKHVMVLLKEKNVQAVANRRFGPNISRVALKFVLIIIEIDEIEKGLDLIIKNYNTVREEMEKGSERKHIKLV